MANEFMIDDEAQEVRVSMIHSETGIVNETAITIGSQTMIIPVDILSYALGLFSKIKFWPYVIATFIGVIPVTFLLAYIGSVPFIYQILAFLIVGIIILVGLIVRKKFGGRS